MTSSHTSNTQAEAERITKELQAGAPGSSSALELLLQRAQVYADLGDEDKAKADISQAAALAREPDASAASVAAVEKAFREISVGSASAGHSKHAGLTSDAIVDSIVQFVAEADQSPEDAANGIAEAAGVLNSRISQNSRHSLLTESQLCQLVDAFHTICERAKLTKDQGTLAAALANCVRSALAQLAVQTATGDDKEPASDPAARSSLVKVAVRIAETWERHQTDGGFKQQTCRLGAAMYTTAAYALSTHEAAPSDSALHEVVRRSFAFCINQLWLIGTLPVAAAEEFRDVGQGILRLLTANRPLFLSMFVTSAPAVDRLLMLLGQALGSERRSMAMLIASQVVASAKDPSNSSRLPDYEPPTARSGAPALALVRLQQSAVRVLDAWVQSTAQAERTQGLLAIAALYEAGVGSDVVAGLWLQGGWVEELWDQGDVDLRPTQLALLALADASSSDAAVGPRMKKAGNGLVQELVRKGAAKSATGEDRGLAERAAVVLAKWSGVVVAAPAAESGTVEAAPTADADPVALADMHMQHISDALAPTGEPDCAAVERATEALGYLCLQPQLKEHVTQNESLLKALFSYATKSAVASLKFSAIMLVRNLTQYRAVLTEEQKRMRQLQQMGAKAQGTAAAAAAANEDDDNPLDRPDRVSARAQLVSAAGAVALLVSAVQARASPSDSVRDAVAQIFVALATTQALRGLVVQQGGVRALLGMLTGDAPKAATPYVPRALGQPRDKHVAFAVAKLAISVPPHLAFSDPREVARLLLSLLLEDAEPQALLMRFEALLALTNLASAAPGSSGDIRGFLANDLGGFSVVETCVLSEHPLVRRAATELVCNLVYDPKVFERYAADADRGVPPEDAKIVELPDDDDRDGYRSQRLHLLVALADVDDTPTRCAAAGALAVLSSDPRCCRYLFLVHPRASDVFLALAADDDDMRAADFKHRVAVIWANAASCGDTRVVEAMRGQGVCECLQTMANDKDMPYCAAATSALEYFA